MAILWGGKTRQKIYFRFQYKQLSGAARSGARTGTLSALLLASPDAPGHGCKDRNVTYTCSISSLT